MQETRKFHRGNNGTKYSELQGSSGLDDSRHAGVDRSALDIANTDKDDKVVIEMSPMHIAGGSSVSSSPADSLSDMEVKEEFMDRTHQSCSTTFKNLDTMNNDAKSNTSIETISFETNIQDDDEEVERKVVLNAHSDEDNDSDDDDEHILSCFQFKSDIGQVNDSSGDMRIIKKKRVPLFLRRNIVIATGSYGLLCMSYIVLDETLPLFLKLDKNRGGFNFGSNNIGYLLSSAGIFMLFFTGIILPKLSSMKKSKLFLIGTLCSIPNVFAWPILAVLNNQV
jgi:hypothetical protein